MGIIYDEAKWETTVYLIDRQTPVLGGNSGPANRAAQQLANRTQWLRGQLQGLESGESPYSSLQAVQEAVTAGKLRNGMYVSVRSSDPTIWVKEFQIISNAPVATGKTVLAGEATEISVTPSITDPDGTITGLNQTVNGQPFRVNFGVTGDIAAIVYVNEEGVARRTATIAGSGAIRKFNETVSQAGALSPYFSTADQFGRTGKGFSAWYKDGEFGSPKARVSNKGLHTEAVRIDGAGMETETIALYVQPGRDFFIDEHGRARFFGGNSDAEGGAGVTYDEGVTLTEPTAVDLWVMGGRGWTKGRNNELMLSGKGTEITRQSCAELPPITGAVIAPLKELAVQTLAFVVQVPPLATIDSSVMVYSSATSATSAGVRCWFRLREDGEITLSAVRREVNSPICGCILPPTVKPGDFIFIAHVMKLDNKDENYQVLYIGGQTYRKLREFDQVTRTLSPRDIGLGNAYYVTEGWADMPTVIAEFSAYDFALNETELRQLFERACVRMKMRGINITR